jgi:SAM-dependent methyltransferase
MAGESGPIDVNMIDEGDLIINRDLLVRKEKALIQRVQDNYLVGLNVGCAQRLFKGWANIDAYPLSPEVLYAPAHELPFRDNSADAIFSAHSLEHIPMRLQIFALRNWFDVLKPGGTLLLSCPDADVIMSILLREDLSPEKYRWYSYCLLGFQASMNIPDYEVSPFAPVDPGQVHMALTSKRKLVPMLEKLGFNIIEARHYNGFDTPGVWIEAVKRTWDIQKVSPL